MREESQGLLTRKREPVMENINFSDEENINISDEEFSFVDVNSNFDVQSLPDSELTSKSSCFEEESKHEILRSKHEDLRSTTNDVDGLSSLIGSVEELSMDLISARKSSRRRRFQDNGLLAHMGNHTSWNFNYKKETSMYISRPFEGALSQVDLVMRENPGARKSSMNKGGNWSYFELLEEHASSRKIHRSEKDLLYIEYEVPVVAMLQLEKKDWKRPTITQEENSKKKLRGNSQTVSYYIETARSNDRATPRKCRKCDKYIRPSKYNPRDGRRELRAYCKQSSNLE